VYEINTKNKPQGCGNAWIPEQDLIRVTESWN